MENLGARTAPTLTSAQIFCLTPLLRLQLDAASPMAKRSGVADGFLSLDGGPWNRYFAGRFLNMAGVGLAVLDRQLCFQDINQALAEMNGLPVEAHRGKSVMQVLGNSAAQIVSRMREVFLTRTPILGFEFSAQLPRTYNTGHWIVNYLPIMNSRGEVAEIGAVVIERVPPLRQMSWSGADLRHRTAVAVDSKRMVSRDCIQTIAGATMMHSRSARSRQDRSNDSRPPDLHGQSNEGHQHLVSLSQRGQEILCFVAEGKSNKQIACMLEISVKTIETHRARLMKKLDLHSVAELVRYAIRNRLIAP